MGGVHLDCNPHHGRNSHFLPITDPSYGRNQFETHSFRSNGPEHRVFGRFPCELACEYLDSYPPLTQDVEALGSPLTPLSSPTQGQGCEEYPGPEDTQDMDLGSSADEARVPHMTFQMAHADTFVQLLKATERVQRSTQEAQKLIELEMERAWLATRYTRHPQGEETAGSRVNRRPNASSKMRLRRSTRLSKNTFEDYEDEDLDDKMQSSSQESDSDSGGEIDDGLFDEEEEESDADEGIEDDGDYGESSGEEREIIKHALPMSHVGESID